MRMDVSELLSALDGARSVIVWKCEMCDSMRIAWWHGGATVNHVYLIDGRLIGLDLWTIYALEELPILEVEHQLREALTEDLCACGQVVDAGAA